MAKKDFSASTEDVFNAFFTQPTETKKKVEAKVPTETQKLVETKKEVKETPTKKENKVSTPKQEEQVEPIKEISKKTEKTRDEKYLQNECRFNFRLDPELADLVNNHLWLTRNKNYTQYFNKLVRENLTEILGLPKNTPKEEVALKWEEYKKENNI